MSSSVSEALQSGKTAVLVIDLQHDFMEGGALAVPGASFTDYLPSVSSFVDLVRSKPDLCLCFSRDFHPPGHSSFASSHLGQIPFTEKQLSRDSDTEDPDSTYMQMLWPDHCVQGTPGSELLIEPNVNSEIVQEKGTREQFDSYSAFKDDGGLKTGLDAKLHERGVENVVLFGLATDYCVFFSGKDAASCGFKNVYVIKELCRGIDQSFDWDRYTQEGCKIVALDECISALNGS